MKNLFLQNQDFENNARFVWNVEVQRFEEKVEKMDPEKEAKEFAEKDKAFAEKQEGLNGKIGKLHSLEAKQAGNPAEVFSEWPQDENETTKPAPEKKEEKDSKKDTEENTENRPTKGLAQRIGKFLGFIKEGDEGVGYHPTAEVEQDIAQQENQSTGIAGMNIAKGDNDANFVDAKQDISAEGGNVDDDNVA
jgi:hypothetical protein